MKIKAASSPAWSDNARTGLDLLVEFEGIGLVPFTATADDKEPHGKDLWTRANAGEFGPIAAMPAQKAAGIRRTEIVQRLQEIDNESLRALRGVMLDQLSGKQAKAADKDKFTTLEAEAEALRAELAALGV